MKIFCLITVLFSFVIGACSAPPARNYRQITGNPEVDCTQVTKDVFEYGNRGCSGSIQTFNKMRIMYLHNLDDSLIGYPYLIEDFVDGKVRFNNGQLVGLYEPVTSTIGGVTFPAMFILAIDQRSESVTLFVPRGSSPKGHGGSTILYFYPELKSEVNVVRFFENSRYGRIITVNNNSCLTLPDKMSSKINLADINGDTVFFKTGEAAHAGDPIHLNLSDEEPVGYTLAVRDNGQSAQALVVITEIKADPC